MTPSYMWIAGVIAAHSNGQLFGRTRLQKTIKLLQRIGLPTDYDFPVYFHGPHSENLQADIKLLEQLGLVTEMSRATAEGNRHCVFQAISSAELPDTHLFRNAIECLQRADVLTLEMAATYTSLRELGIGADKALEKVRQKKGSKCSADVQAAALALITELGIE